MLKILILPLWNVKELKNDKLDSNNESFNFIIMECKADNSDIYYVSFLDFNLTIVKCKAEISATKFLVMRFNFTIMECKGNKSSS